MESTKAGVVVSTREHKEDMVSSLKNQVVFVPLVIESLGISALCAKRNLCTINFHTTLSSGFDNKMAHHKLTEQLSLQLYNYGNVLH